MEQKKKLNLLQRIRRKYNAIRIESKAWRGHYAGTTAWSKRPKQINTMWMRDGIPEYREQMIDLLDYHLRLNPDWTLLDCGCGTGLTFMLLPDEYKENYNGVDFTPEMVDFCRENFPEYSDKFNVVNLLELNDRKSLVNQQYNLCFTQNVLQHIAPYNEALEEILMATKNVVLLCERTEMIKPTIMKELKPYVKWNFNMNRFFDVLNIYGSYYGFSSEVIGHPESTEKLKNVLTIYRMEKIYEFE